jgi:hypothetical protein
LFIVYKKIRRLESVVIFSPIPTGFFVPAEFFRGWRGKTPKNRLCRVWRRKNASWMGDVDICIQNTLPVHYFVSK